MGSSPTFIFFFFAKWEKPENFCACPWIPQLKWLFCNSEHSLQRGASWEHSWGSCCGPGSDEFGAQSFPWDLSGLGRGWGILAVLQELPKNWELCLWSQKIVYQTCSIWIDWVLTLSEPGFHLSSVLPRSSKLHSGICFAEQGLLAGEDKCQSAPSLSFHLNGKGFSCFFCFLLTNISAQWVFQDCGLGLT